MVVKDKRDSKGELLLLCKSRLAIGGHLTNSGLRQDITDSEYGRGLHRPRHHAVQSDSVTSPRPISIFLCPRARSSHVTACGNKHRPNDSTTWKRVERKDRKTTAVSITLVFVDDFMHIWKTYTGSDRIRDKLHVDLRFKELSPLECSNLAENNLISFLGLSIQMLPGFRLFVSQPRYATALAEQSAYKCKQESPLPPPDFNSRTVSEEDQELLGEKDTSSHYTKEIMSIA